MTGPRAGQVLPVLRAITQTVRWEILAGATVCSALLLWWQDDRLVVPSAAMWLLRGVALLLAAAVAFAPDDAARGTLGALPTPLWWRSAVRIVPPLGLSALVWGAAVVWVAARVARPLPWGDLALETAAFWALTLGTSCGVARWRHLDEPGYVVAPLVLCVGLLLTELPERVSLVTFPGADWDDAHLRVAAVLGAALVVLALSVADPARRGVRGLAPCVHP
jgi:hypothetical protein